MLRTCQGAGMTRRRLLLAGAIIGCAALLVVAPWQRTAPQYGRYIAACKQHHVLRQCLESLIRWKER
jgi:hypothetical protein